MACDINLSASLTKDQSFLKLLKKKNIDHFTKHFGIYIIIGEFNLKPSHTNLKQFLAINWLCNLIKDHTCFKVKGSLTEVMQNNRKFSFKNIQSFGTSLGDHHMVYVMLKASFHKAEL